MIRNLNKKADGGITFEEYLKGRGKQEKMQNTRQKLT